MPKSPASQPRPLPIYGAQFWERRPRHPPVTGQQRAQTPPRRPFALCRHTVGWTQACKLIGFALCCHSNATRAPIANPPNSAQLGAASTTPPIYIRVRAVVWAYGRGQTDTHTHTQTCVTTIHFASSTTHAKCNNLSSIHTDGAINKISSVYRTIKLNMPRVKRGDLVRSSKYIVVDVGLSDHHLLL